MGNRIWSKTYGIVHGAELRSIRQIPLRTNWQWDDSAYRPARGDGGGGGTPYNGLYGVDPPEMGTFFRFRVYERWGFHYN